MIPPRDRFARYVQRGDECWEWTGARNAYGYGVFKLDGRVVMAHRFSYEAEVGLIPDGLQLDHLCRVRHCVNPAHLEPVTSRENLLRGSTITAANAAKTHCKRGHEFTPENTYVDKKGRRDCRACRRVDPATGRPFRYSERQPTNA